MNNIVASHEITDQTAMFQGLQFGFLQALLVAYSPKPGNRLVNESLHPLDIVN